MKPTKQRWGGSFPSSKEPPKHVFEAPANWANATASVAGSFEDCQAEARRLTLEGKFAVVEAYYDGTMADYEFKTEPFEDDFDDPDEYEEAREEYEDWYENQSVSSYTYPEDVELKSYYLSYSVNEFASREEFEEKLKDGSTPQYGSGNSIIGFNNKEKNGKVASDVDVDPYNEGRVFNYELFTYDNES